MSDEAPVYPWRVWRAFERESARAMARDDGPLWRALFQACRGPDGKCDIDEYERWLDVFIWYPRGDA